MSAPVIDCLRLDFMLDPILNLPQYSIAVIGRSRGEVLRRKEWILRRIGMNPFHERWMSADDSEANEESEEMDDGT